SPDEVEAALSTADGVRELCVFGVASEYWTEVVVCAYVAANGMDNSDAESQGDKTVTALQNTANSLTKYKRPRIYTPVTTLAKTPAGKIDRRENRRQLLIEHRLNDGAYP